MVLMANQTQIGLYAEKLQQEYNDTTLTNAYTNYFLSHPNANPESIYNQVVARLTSAGAELGTLPDVLKQFLGDAGTGVSQEAEGGGLGVAQASADLQPGAVLGQIWSKLNNRGTWIRIAEGALGVALILVAIAHMTGADSVANLPAAVAKQARKVSKT
jgi:hypothetical protein